MKNILNKKKNRGFTIIETMVAVSLFLVITTIGLGALLNASSLYQKSRDMRSIIDSLNYAMEDMSRSIRTGYNYHCIDVSSAEGIPGGNNYTNLQDCTKGWALAFYPAGVPNPTENDMWIYYISDYLNNEAKAKIFKSTTGGLLDSSFTQITPDEVSINPVLSSFTVTGTQQPNGDTRQPFVTIHLVGTITYKGVVSPFSLQTSVSQRMLDI